MFNLKKKKYSQCIIIWVAVKQDMGGSGEGVKKRREIDLGCVSYWTVIQNFSTLETPIK